MSIANKSSLLYLLNGNKYQTYNRVIAHASSLEAAILLNELADKYEFFSREGMLLEEEWFYLTLEGVEERTCLSRRHQDTAIKKLTELGIIQTKLIGCPPRRHFKFDFKKLEDFLSAANQFVQSAKLKCTIRQIAPIYKEEPKEEPNICPGGQPSASPPPLPLPSPKRKKIKEVPTQKAERIFITPSQHDSLLKKASGNENLVCYWYDKYNEWKIGKGLMGGSGDYQAIVKWVIGAYPIILDFTLKDDKPNTSGKMKEKDIKNQNRNFAFKIKMDHPLLDDNNLIGFGDESIFIIKSNKYIYYNNLNFQNEFLSHLQKMKQFGEKF